MTKASPGEDLDDAPIVESRQQIGAVRIRSAKYGVVWLALTASVAAELRAEEASREAPRPVLTGEDVARLRGKSEAAVRAVVEVATAFPGARVLQ